MKETFFKQRPIPEASGSHTRLERNLASIYRSSDGRKADLSRLEPVQTRSRVGALKVLLVLGIVGVLGWFFFSSRKAAKFGEEAVALSLTGPSVLRAGELGTWKVLWNNTSPTALTQMRVSLERERSFTLRDVRPAAADPQTQRWSVADTSTGASGLLEFDGVSWAAPGSDLTTEVSLGFAPEQWGARFTRRATMLTKIVESTLTSELDGPTQIIGGGIQTYTVRVNNSGPDSVLGVKVVITPPGTFTVSSTRPDIADIGGTLVANSLSVPGRSSVVFDIIGSYVEASQVLPLRSNEWKVETFVRPLEGLEDLKQSSSSLPVVFVAGDVLLTTLVGESIDTRSVDLGSTLPIAVSLKNEGGSALEDILLKIIVTAVPESAGSLLNWERTEHRDAEQVDHSIVYSAQTLGALERVASKESVDVRAKLPLLSVVDPASRAAGDIAFDIKAVATLGKTDGVVLPRELTSNVVRVRVNSDLNVEAHPRYFSDENLALGSGPLPPRVGQMSTVRILWNVKNTLHELLGLSMVAMLPPDVVWTGNARVAAGTIRFDERSREIRWTVNRMPTSVRLLDADFELAVTPSGSDVGALLTLLKKITFEAEDAVTHTLFRRAVADLDTNLVGDPFASGKGVVAR